MEKINSLKAYDIRSFAYEIEHQYKFLKEEIEVKFLFYFFYIFYFLLK
jgi:hypothetical protein